MSEHSLQRGLKNRHIQLIAMGGAIGTGLFLGAGHIIPQAGPSIILGYAIGGFIAFLIMRQLGEMVVEEPVAGSFAHFAYKYWGKFAGFITGWNYWIVYVLVAMGELTAVGTYIHYWWADIPIWLSVLFFFIVITIINLFNVKIYGESEFWLSIIKVVAIICMILLGAYLLITADSTSISSITNLWQHGGFFPNGFDGLFYMLAFIMFAFGGIELIGMTAAEADHPQKSIPQAINQVVWRILLFYVLALAILLSLVPWNQLQFGSADHLDKSPFVLIFSQIGIDWAAHLLNFIILTAALSVYNSGMYANSRMLYSLAQQGNAPKLFAKTNHKGIPINAALFSSILIFSCVILNFFFADTLKHLMYISVGILVSNWAIISITHLKFIQQKRKENHKTYFPALFSPFSNYLVLAFVAVIFYVMTKQGFLYAVILMPIWTIAMYILYRLFKPQHTA